MAASQASSGLAICTTLKLPDFGAAPLESFVRYHWAVGFDHIFLFYDDPDDPTLPVARRLEAEAAAASAASAASVASVASASEASATATATATAATTPSVTVVLHDESLRATWAARCPSFPDMAPFAAAEVQARQHLNCEVALELAAARGVRWLLHIDIDELFFTANDGGVAEHFAMLDRRGVHHMTYLNHEGVPESPDVVDYFSEVTLFRRHPFRIPLSAETRRGMNFWRGRTNHGQYLLCYDNGKSAVRVLPGVRPRSVHTWVLPAGGIDDEGGEGEDIGRAEECTGDRGGGEGKGEEDGGGGGGSSRGGGSGSEGGRGGGRPLCSKTALADPRSLDLAKVLRCDDPCILHFVTCGVRWFRSKYAILGDFDDSWFGGKLPIAPSFHLDCRDVTGHSSSGGEGGGDGSDDRVLAFYRAQVMAAPPDTAEEEIARQIDAGVLFRTSRVASVLKKKTKKQQQQQQGGGTEQEGQEHEGQEQAHQLGGSGTGTDQNVGTCGPACTEDVSSPSSSSVVQSPNVDEKAAPHLDTSALDLAARLAAALGGGGGGGGGGVGCGGMGGGAHSGASPAGDVDIEKNWILSSVAQKYL